MTRIALLLACSLLLPLTQDRDELHERGFDSISELDLSADLTLLAGPRAEGRDSPSAGQSLAAEHIAQRLAAAGYSGAGPEGSFLLPFTRRLPAPVPERCRLSADGPDGPTELTYGEDFVPVWHAEGQATGEAVLLGFGIDSSRETYDDVTGDLDGVVAVIVSGEPRHRRKFDGPELSPDANLYTKLATLKQAGVAGVLLVRRPPALPEPASSSRRRRNAQAEPTPPEPAPLGFRHTWARWIDEPGEFEAPVVGLPVLEITPAAALAVTGLDVLAPLDDVDRKAKAPKPVFSGRTVSLAAASELRDVTLFNVAGTLTGSDQTLADEYVVIGAHYDHLGVDVRGRVGFGADDNASGTSALMEVAQALAQAGPRRSILACAFAAEEDGLLGSDALAGAPPVPAQQLVAMINMDMLGYGDAGEVAVIGVPENPAFEKLLKRAKKLKHTKVKKIITGQGQEVFKRSDHYNFHRRGVPSLFFFEGLPVGSNPHYHTWHDTLDTIDIDKIARTARLVFNTAWLLAEDDERPPPPRNAR
ncbi:MAG: hypothetical protein DRQ55_12970 [Planctomycetota bacterium]|nr:MAG: hypothetical protein DRQ55_12970 [Planctomycetota bacterium]